MNARSARRLALWGFVLVAGSFALGAAGLAGVFWWYGRGIASLDEDRLKNYQPPQVTRILARDGTLIGEVFSERRTKVTYDTIPSHVENAFLSAEDADFYRHEGMDYFGMIRALLANVKAGEIRQGASTITQQVVKTFMLSPERTLERKVQELILARRLEQGLTKRQILELYLNEIYLGHGRYGIEEASRFYFGKGVADIDLGQAAVLAALPKAPGRDSPIQNPARAKERQVYVLQQMVRHGFATARDAKRFIDRPLSLVGEGNETLVVGGAEEFVGVAREQLEQRYGADALESLGATVTTTVDLKLQAAAKKGLRDGLVAVDRRQGYGHRIKPAKDANLARAQKRGSGDLVVGNVYPIVIGSRATDQELPAEGFVGKIGPHDVFVRVPKGSRYDDPELDYDAQFPAGGITMARVTRLPVEADVEAVLPIGWAEAEIGSGPEGAVLLADVATGEVLAMIGGADFRIGQFDRARAARRQPGSAFKPFVYGAALHSRQFTAASIVSDSPEIYDKWRPTNFEPDVYRGDIRLRAALTHSVNTIAIKLLDAIGFEAVHAFAKAAGIQSALVANLSLALGTSEVTPIELLGGYLTLARGGSRVPPTFITAIDVPGQERWIPTVEPEQALEQDVVFILTSMMRSVVDEGTGKGARALDRPVAGKTGTSADNRDAWFAGFTPKHVAVAWVGFDTPKRIGRKETGGRAALPIWLAAMQAAEASLPPADFVPPAAVSVRTIDARTGLLAPTSVGDPLQAPAADASDDDAADATGPATLEEYFLGGTEPVDEVTPEAMPAGDVLLDLYGTAVPDAQDPAPADPRGGVSPGDDGSQPAQSPEVREPSVAAVEPQSQLPDPSRLPSLDDGI